MMNRSTTFIRFSGDMPKPYISSVIKKKFSNYGSVYDNGRLFRPFDPKTLRFGYDGDDFIYNRFTVTMDQRVYPKVPRILSACYRVKKYRPSRRHR